MAMHKTTASQFILKNITSIKNEIAKLCKINYSIAEVQVDSADPPVLSTLVISDKC